MNKARAMLDALMGPSRDQAKDANSQDWKDRSVCRGYLVGFCPCDKGVLGGKRTLDVCPKIHSEVLRSKFEEHHDSGEHSEFRIRCEEISLRDCEWAVLECDAHSRREQERLKREPKPRRLPPEVNQKISATKREIEQLKLKSETLDDCEARQKENLLKQAETMAADIEAYQKEEEKKAIDALPKGTTCDVCGTAYTGDDEYKQHLKYKVHDGYAAVREHIALMRKKKEERDAEKGKKDEERKRKNEEAIKKDENGKHSDDEKKDKDKKKDRKDRSGSKDDKKKEKEDDKKKDKEKGRSRSKDDKKKEKEDDKKKDKEKGKRSRSRDSRDKNRDKDKDKNKGKDRSRDRGKSRDRSRDGGKDRSRDRDKKKDKGRSRSRSRDRGKDKDRDRKRSRSKRRSKSRSRKRR